MSIILAVLVPVLLALFLTFLGQNGTNLPGTQAIPMTPAPKEPQGNMQLRTFPFVTITPKPKPPANPNSCVRSRFNEEPQIFVASIPGPNSTVPAGTEIKAWTSNEGGGLISRGSQLDPATGLVIKPGDRSATDGKGANYYPIEPAIYLTPLSSPDQAGPYSGDAENGGKPYFPYKMLGYISPNTGRGTQRWISVPRAEIPPEQPEYQMMTEYPIKSLLGPIGTGNRRVLRGFLTEYIWQVSSFGLPSGTYRIQYVVHDGDGDLAISCSTIVL